MKRVLIPFLWVIVVLWPCSLSAQKTVRGVIQAAVGTDLSSVLPDDVAYMYPQFIKGTVLFQDYGTAEGMMNLYLLGSNIHFIDPKGDTLELTNQDQVRVLSLGQDTYMRYNKAYVRIIESNGEVALGIRSIVNVDQSQKMGAYGMMTSTASITEVQSIDHPGTTGVTYLKSLKNLPYTLKHDVLMYSADKLYVANKRNFIKLFPDKKEAIEAYIKEKKPDLENAKDALALFNFCQQ